jgi:hypothetical protein
MNPFAFELGQTVNVLGAFNGGVIVQRGIWESLSYPPTTFYIVRLGDKELTVSEAEVSAA